MQKLTVLGVVFAWLFVVAGGCGDRADAVAVKGQDGAELTETQAQAEIDALLEEGQEASEPDANGGTSANSSNGGGATVSTAARASTDSVTLRLNLKKGSSYKFLTEATTEGGMPGNTSTIKQTIEHNVGVTDLKGDKFVIEMKVSDVKVDMPAEARNQMGNPAQMIEEMKKLVWVGDYDPFGNATNIRTTGGDEMVRMMVGQTMNVGFMGISFPKEAVKVGSKWDGGTINLSEMLPPMGEMVKVKSGGKIPMKYEVKGIEQSGGKTVVIIQFTANGNMELAVQAPTQDGSTQEQVMRLTLDSTGTARVDAGTGLPLSVLTNGNAGMNVMGMEMNQKTRSNMRLVQ